MEVLSYKEDSVFVPFTMRKSKDNRVVFDENDNMVALPVEPVVDFIKDVKNEIEQDCFLTMGDVLVTDIFTDNEGWPIGLQALFTDHDYDPSIFVGFRVRYNTERNNDVSVRGIMLCISDEDVICDVNNIDSFDEYKDNNICN